MRLFKAFMPLLCSLGFVFLTHAHLADAKDLQGRLGVGFNNQFSNSLPALSAKYGLTREIHVQGILGFETSSPGGFTLGGKIYKNIFYETNLNFYTAAALAYLKRGVSGFEMDGVFGCEFFVPGIDSLGLMFEGGVAATNISGSFVLKTVGYTFLHAGMHFYF